jgi:uncharacterized pyridoxamine 5'-phosphate oxidase family protein
MLTEEALEFLKSKKFINIATCDFDNRPNVAPKFLLKVENGFIYLIDYVKNTTLKNIKINTRVSLSTINVGTLTGYQINGIAEVIDKGKMYKNLLREYSDKQLTFSTERIVKTLREGKKDKVLEIQLPEEVVVLKIKIKEIVGIGLRGNLERKQL